jgi:hypothetical protein
MIDAPIRPAETHMHAPYDLLRPVRCRRVVDGRACNARNDGIDWSRPQFKEWRCGKCGAFNVLMIVEATRGDSAGPL